MEPVLVRHFSVSLADLPSALDGLRIIHLTDLHARRWDRVLAGAQQVIMGLEYDLLAVTGDIGHRPDRWQDTAGLVRRFFAPLHSRHGNFAVLGNHDSPSLASAEDLNLTFLRDQGVGVHHNGGDLWLAGVEQTEESPGSVSAALAGRVEGTAAVLLAHYPSTVYEAARDHVELVLAGHTHGGQIRFPLLGCVWANDRIPRSMAQGLHGVDGTRLHVSAGIGLSGFLPARFRCPPELALLTLRAPTPTVSLDEERLEQPAEEIEVQKRPVAV